MPKAVYRSSRHGKHNCQRRDLNLGPVTPQSDTTNHSATETCRLDHTCCTEASAGRARKRNRLVVQDFERTHGEEAGSSQGYRATLRRTHVRRTFRPAVLRRIALLVNKHPLNDCGTTTTIIHNTHTRLTALFLGLPR